MTISIGRIHPRIIYSGANRVREVYVGSHKIRPTPYTISPGGSTVGGYSYRYRPLDTTNTNNCLYPIDGSRPLTTVGNVAYNANYAIFDGSVVLYDPSVSNLFGSVAWDQKTWFHFWINVDSGLTARKTIFTKYITTVNYRFQFGVNSDYTLLWETNGTWYPLGSVVLTPGTWYMISLLFTKTAASAYHVDFYLNGDPTPFASSGGANDFLLSYLAIGGIAYNYQGLHTAASFVGKIGNFIMEHGDFNAYRLKNIYNDSRGLYH